ncbi:hypothetical protein B7494_g5230 [Chlorociboria aeruginascens]|nr:hypothetical protein B7494_g5230 [Chlorociboria aeruginascens]
MGNRIAGSDGLRVLHAEFCRMQCLLIVQETYAHRPQIEYTFGHLIPTLVMVESPQAALFSALPNDDPDAPLTETKIEPELLLIKSKPITSGFRSTILHLRAKAGFWSRFRGAAASGAYTFCLSWTAQFISAFRFIPMGTAPVLAAVLCAQLSMTWTHIVISEPRTVAWYKRIPSLKLWKKIAGPTAMFAIAKQLAILLPTYLLTTYSLPRDGNDLQKMSTAELQLIVLKGLSVIALAITLSFLIVLPANVALTRVQASLLADTEESIVPFDRTFGGKVIPEIAGGSGHIGFVDAWKTFEWCSFANLINAYGKVILMEFFVMVLFVLCILGEVIFVLGDEINKIPGLGKNGAKVTIN